MFILRELLPPLQDAFSESRLGRERANWFIQSLLAVIVPFTSSMSANLLRSLTTLFGLSLSQRRFYTFMASSTLPWHRLWRILWGLIPAPLSAGRLVVALDDFINPKTGRSIFGCERVFDHAAKANQSQYPWAQNVVTVGLLRHIKDRWACLPLAARFYLPQAALVARKPTMRRGRDVPEFRTKLEQAAEMLTEVAAFFAGVPVLAVADSWFGNNGLVKPMREAIGMQFQLLSRLRSNTTLHALPPPRRPGQRGRPRTYGARLGSTAQMAAQLRGEAQPYTVDLYGQVRTVTASTAVLMLHTLKCPVRVVWVYRKTRWVALFTTDLRLSVELIIAFYGARWKIEAAFRELKQEIGSQRCQARTACAVSNHLQLCLMAMSITWMYAARLHPHPQRRHTVRGRTSFAFSDVRRLIAKAALSGDFQHICLTQPTRLKNSLIDTLLRMVA